MEEEGFVAPVAYEEFNPDNLNELIVEEVNNLSYKTWVYLFGGEVEDAEHYYRRLQKSPIEDIMEFPKVFGDSYTVQTVYSHCLEKLYKRWVKNVEKEEFRFARKTTYLPEPVLYWNPVRDREKQLLRHSFRFEPDLRCAGLLKHIQKHEAPEETAPCALQVLNLGTEEIPEEKWDEFSKEGFAVSRRSLVWRKDSVAYKYIQAALPKVIDTNPYNRRLNSACEPGGVMFDLPIMISQVQNWDGSARGVDGSGVIDYRHPIFEQMHIKPCAIQFTIINKDGWFGKGMLRVGNVMVRGEPGIQLDWEQIKGKHKSFAKKMMRENPGKKILIHAHIGVLSVNSKPRKISWGFQQLEKFQNNSYTRETIARHNLDNSLKIIEKLPDMVSKLKDSSLTLGKLVKLLEAQPKNKKGESPVDPLRVAEIRKEISGRLAKKFWKLATGAGIKSPYLKVFMDSAVEKGYVVIHDPRFKDVNYGQEVLVWRTPTLLAQGMSRMRRAVPTAEQNMHAKYNQYCCFMNPEDLSVLLQGDDDGDDVAIEARKDLVDLTRHRVTDDVFLIERDGKSTPIDLNLDTPEGMNYLKNNPQGQVGMFTIALSKLLAGGDVMGSVAAAALAQVAIDYSKRKLIWPNYKQAAHLGSWRLNKKTGYYHFDADIEEGDLDPNDMNHPNMKRFWRWTSHRLAAEGWEYEEQRDILEYRKIGVKRLEPQNIRKVHEFSLVEYCWNQFVDNYTRHIRDASRLDKPTQNISKLLHFLMQRKVGKVQFRIYDWDVYRKGLRNTCGLQRYMASSAVMNDKNWNNSENEEDSKHMYSLASSVGSQRIAILEKRMRKAIVEQKVSLQEMLDIWSMETQAEKGSVFGAINAIMFDGSPVKQILDIQEHAECPSIHHEVLELVTDYCIHDEKPFDRLARVLTGAARKTGELKVETHTIECGWCCEMHTKHLISELRHKNSHKEFVFTRELVGKLNKGARFERPAFERVRRTDTSEISFEDYMNGQQEY